MMNVQNVRILFLIVSKKTFFVLNFYVHIRCGWFSFKKGYQKGIEIFTCIYLIMCLSKKYMSLC